MAKIKSALQVYVLTNFHRKYTVHIYVYLLCACIFHKFKNISNLKIYQNISNLKKSKLYSILYIIVPVICIASYLSSSRNRDCICFLVLCFNVADN